MVELHKLIVPKLSLQAIKQSTMAMILEHTLADFHWE